ncbi:MAG: hypothetical protein RLZZ597_1106 [Cyanobacteriota bacterium]|jgi:hypothetical protein
MARPLDTIQREIESLTETTLSLSAEFRRLYSGYLDSLGLAVRRQVVMATYHLCTQIYPERFLALSVAQRERLQRQVRHLGQEGQARLAALLDNAASPTIPNSADLAHPPRLPEGSLALHLLPGQADGEAPEQPEGSSLTEGNELGNTELEDPQMPLPSLLRSMVLAALAEEMGENPGQPLFTSDTMTPTQLAKQHIFLEQKIRATLQTLSRQVNQRLLEAQVLPNLPEAILDAASETDLGPMRGRSVPNVLSVLVTMADNLGDALDDESSLSDDRPEDLDEDDHEEDEDDDDAREGSMTHLAAVHLRLADLEFGHVQSSLWRSKLRTALGHLRKLGKRYQKVQRELATAEAEQAWRAIWYDDNPSV